MDFVNDICYKGAFNLTESVKNGRPEGLSVFGNKVPVSTIKNYIGHTLGACGAIEAWSSINMMNEGWFAPNINLTEPDPNCAPLDYIMGDGREAKVDYVMSNNFAFGGINTSLIFKRFS